MESPALNAEEKKKFGDIRYVRAGKIEVMRSLQKTCCYYWLSENCKGKHFRRYKQFFETEVSKWFEDSSKKWNRTEFIKSVAWQRKNNKINKKQESLRTTRVTQTDSCSIFT